jgi:hypothetical protein
MAGTLRDQIWRKPRNTGGQLEEERSIGGACLPVVVRGSGTEGGSVVQRSAAKKRHSAGPIPISL